MADGTERIKHNHSLSRYVLSLCQLRDELGITLLLLSCIEPCSKGYNCSYDAQLTALAT